LREEQRRAWLDQPLPRLEGRTPREAAGDPALRGRVAGLVKRQVMDQDRENLRTGGTADVGWLARELGLTEIDVPAPPPRPVVAAEDDEDEAREAPAEMDARLP